MVREKEQKQPQRETLQPAKYRLQAGRGSGRHLLVRSAPIVRDGRPGGFCSVFADVTDHERLQATLAHADRLANTGLLAAGVAHDINNILSGLLFHLQKIADDLPGTEYPTPDLDDGKATSAVGDGVVLWERRRIEELRRRVGTALDGAHRVRDIVQELGSFASAEEDQQVSFSINEAIDRAVAMAKKDIQFRARLIKEYGRLPTLAGAEGKMVQVFLNLLLNAAQAIPPGAVEEHTICIRTWFDEPAVVIEISDSGEGIAEQHLSLLFDPFFSTKENDQGSGLGLYICHEIITNFGGSLEVTSTVGEGAQFTVRLPVEAMADP
jgi:signal transduction histidine kinase